MSKLLDRLHIHPGVHEREQEAPERVPESHEVKEHGRRSAAPPPRAARGVRWLRWLPVIALLAAGIVTFTLVVNDSGTDVGQDVAAPAGSSYELVQDAIDQAILDNQITTLDRAVLDLERNATTTPVGSYQLVQDAIDEALAANATAPVSSYQLVQDAIDQAIAANNLPAYLDSQGVVLRPGMPDGYWQPNATVATESANAETADLSQGVVLRPGMPDGYWQPNLTPATESVNAETADLSQGVVLRPGMPDGYWQPAADTPSTSVPDGGCRISGPC